MRSWFDEVPERGRLSTARWELERERTGDPTLLCFGTADMDFASAPPIVAALEEVARTGHFGYPHKRDSYYEAIVGYCERRLGWRIERDWVATNVGIYPSMQTLIEQLSGPGDEVAYFTPVHHIFREVVASNGRTPVEVPLVVDDDGVHRFDLGTLRDRLGDRARLFLLCNPHNPVGRAWTPEELRALGEVCRDAGVVVIADEVYSGLVLPGHTFTPFASLSPELSRTTVTVTSASKPFNLTGLKHSLVIAEDPDLRATYRAGLERNNLFFGGSTFGIAATEAAYRDGDAWTDELVTYVAGTVEQVRTFAAEHLPGITVNAPEATYFSWWDCRGLGLDDEALVAWFERDAHVVVTPGAAMGPGGAGHVRFNVASPRALVDEGLARIAAALR